MPVEVVPGVSQRGRGPGGRRHPGDRTAASPHDFAVVSGHLAPGTARLDGGLAGAADGPATLVLLMALDRLDAVAGELVKRGRPPSTPVAVIRRATLPDQQVLIASLDTVAAEVARTGLRPPAVVVVGEVVGLRDSLWGGAPPG